MTYLCIYSIASCAHIYNMDNWAHTSGSIWMYNCDLNLITIFIALNCPFCVVSNIQICKCCTVERMENGL